VTWAIVKPHSAWLAQAKDAWAALEPQAPQGAQLCDLAAIDHDTFALLIEALCALTRLSRSLDDAVERQLPLQKGSDSKTYLRHHKTRDVVPMLSHSPTILDHRDCGRATVM